VNQTTLQQYADLRAFRQKISLAISKRHYAAFNALDALLERPKPSSIAELSFSPFCPRQWGSLYDMIENAVFDKAELEAVYRHASLEDWREHGKEQALVYGFGEPCLVISSDASMIRRSSCRVVDGLRYCHTQSHEVGSRGIVVGHQYQLLRYVGEAHTSWSLPLMHDRLGENDTAISLAAGQIQRFSAALPQDVPALCALDGGYGNAPMLAETRDQRCGIIARMRHDRDLWYAPPPVVVKRRGAPRLYGEAFDTKDATTWRMPDDDCQFSHKSYGRVHLQRWNGLLMRPPKSNNDNNNDDNNNNKRREEPLRVDVLRCTIHCQAAKPITIWLVFQANGLPKSIAENTIAIWHTFSARSGIEASIKASKQELSWSMPQTLTAEAADRWTHLTDIAFWHLFLARKSPNLLRYPWQKKEIPVTPRRVKQSMAAILLAVGTPAKAPRLRGKSQGWETGRPRTKKKPIPVIYKGRKKTKQDSS
jgi:hypothetical protein